MKHNWFFQTFLRWNKRWFIFTLFTKGRVHFIPLILLAKRNTDVSRLFRVPGKPKQISFLFYEAQLVFLWWNKRWLIFTLSTKGRVRFIPLILLAKRNTDVSCLFRVPGKKTENFTPCLSLRLMFKCYTFLYKNRNLFFLYTFFKFKQSEFTFLSILLGKKQFNYSRIHFWSNFLKKKCVKSFLFDFNFFLEKAQIQFSKFPSPSGGGATWVADSASPPPSVVAGVPVADSLISDALSGLVSPGRGGVVVGDEQTLTVKFLDLAYVIGLKGKVTRKGLVEGGHEGARVSRVTQPESMPELVGRHLEQIHAVMALRGPVFRVIKVRIPTKLRPKHEVKKKVASNTS